MPRIENIRAAFTSAGCLKLGDSVLNMFFFWPRGGLKDEKDEKDD